MWTVIVVLLLYLLSQQVSVTEPTFHGSRNWPESILHLTMWDSTNSCMSCGTKIIVSVEIGKMPEFHTKVAMDDLFRENIKVPKTVAKCVQSIMNILEQSPRLSSTGKLVSDEGWCTQKNKRTHSDRKPHSHSLTLKSTVERVYPHPRPLAS